MRKMNISKLFGAIAILLAAPLLVTAQQGESRDGRTPASSFISGIAGDVTAFAAMVAAKTART